MDAYKSMTSGGGCIAIILQLVGCLLSCSFAAAAIALVVFLGKYSFNNPDADAWYGVTTNAVTGITTEGLFTSEIAAGTATELDDVHSHFVVWFLWGFIQSLAPCGIAIVAGILGLINAQAASCCGGLLFASWNCSGLAWYIAGLVWRCRQSGSFASGDIMPANSTEEAWMTEITADGSLYQYSSGNFIWTYYLIGWIIMGSLCGLGCLCSIVGCMCK